MAQHSTLSDKNLRGRVKLCSQEEAITFSNIISIDPTEKGLLVVVVTENKTVVFPLSSVDWYEFERI